MKLLLQLENRVVSMVEFLPTGYLYGDNLRTYQKSWQFASLRIIKQTGQKRSPEVQKIQRDMIELALKRGVAPRVEIDNFEEAKPFLEMGVRHFCIGEDLSTIYGWCK